MDSSRKLQKLLPSLVLTLAFSGYVFAGETIRWLQPGQFNMAKFDFAADTGELVTISNYDVKFWDMPQVRFKRTLWHNIPFVTDGDVSPNAERLVIADGRLGQFPQQPDNWVHLISATTGTTIGCRRHAQDFVKFVRWAPNGKYFLAVSRNADRYRPVVRAYSPDFEGVYEYIAKTYDGSEVAAAEISPDSSTFFVATAANIYFFRVGQTLPYLTIPTTVATAALSQFGSYIATGTYQGVINIWDYRLGIQVASFDTGNHSTVESLEFDESTGRLYASLLLSGENLAIDLASWSYEWRRPPTSMSGGAFEDLHTPGEGNVFYGLSNYQVFPIEKSTGEIQPAITNGDSLECIGTAVDPNILICVSGLRVCAIDANTAEEIWSRESEGKSYARAISRDRTLVAAGDSDGVSVFSTLNGVLHKRINYPAGSGSIAISSDNRTIVFMDEFTGIAAKMNVWSLETLQPISQFSPGSYTRVPMVFSGDGSRLICNFLTFVRAYRTDDWTVAGEFASRRHERSELALSNSGDRIAIWTHDPFGARNSVTVRRTSDLGLIRTFPGGWSDIQFTSNDSTLWSNEGQVLRAINISSGQTAYISSHNELKDVRSFHVLPDGSIYILRNDRTRMIIENPLH